MPEKTFKIIELANPAWFDKPEEGSIWVSCYRAFRISDQSIPEGVKTLDLGDLRIVFLAGSLKYYDSNALKIHFETETQWQLDGSDYKERDTPKGIYTLFVVPYDDASPDKNEASTRAKISAYLGLLAAFQGRNLVHHRVLLSLRWFEQALFDHGIDAFLKYWIAVETVGMPDTSNIRPLIESLAVAYGESNDDI